MVLATLTHVNAAWSAESLETHRDVVYAERGEKKLLADVYMPPGEGPFPGTLMIHGRVWGDARSMASRISSRQLHTAKQLQI